MWKAFFARRRAALLAAPLCLLVAPLWAGSFLQMPDITDLPELERDSLLLDMDIPAVRERSSDPEAGPRLNVKEFRVQGIVEFPELGILRSEIIEQVERIRFDFMNEDSLLESGYTLDELAAISDLIVEIEREAGDRHVGPMEVQRLVFHIREQRRQRGITLGMIEAVADTITQYYRERGFILAKAYIPKQQVRDGVVTLTVLLGDLGEVSVHNNRRYSQNTVRRPFNGLLDKPVTSHTIEERLFLVNDMPGLSAQAFFEPGAQVGDSAMAVYVLSERWYDANIRFDNHGSESSGEYRLYADLFLHNPTGIGDQIHLAFLNSFEPDNSTYGAFRYNTPLYFPRLRFSVGASTNQFELARGESEGINELEISGGSEVIDASLEYILTRRRVKNTSLRLGFSEIKSKVQFGDIRDRSLDDIVRNVDLRYQFDFLNERRRILHQGSVGVTLSEFVMGADAGQEENPWIIPFNYTMLTFVKIPFVDVETRLVVRTSGQYSGTSLSSINQFSLAGPRRARAYALNAFYADDGAHVGADWIFRAPGGLGDYFQPMLFADYSYGVAYESVEGADSAKAELSNVGVGGRFTIGPKVRGSLTVAHPLTAKQGDRSLDEGVQLYMDMQYSF
jgi:hemolysin activation/secretion protein